MLVTPLPPIDFNNPGGLTEGAQHSGEEPTAHNVLRGDPGGNAGESEVNLPIDQLLPRFTRVVIRGNNRTKVALVGKSGVVKKSNGLGGWHLIVLDDSGEEVRLQRNALAVVSAPSGTEADFTDDEETEAQHELTDALPRARRRRPTRPVSAPEFSLAERRTSQRQAAQQPRINFHRLDSVALRRYRRFYQLPDVGPNSTKDQLVSAVGRHFQEQTVDEDRVIASFVKAVRDQAVHRPTIGEEDEYEYEPAVY